MGQITSEVSLKNVAEDTINPATEDKQDDVVTALSDVTQVNVHTSQSELRVVLTGHICTENSTTDTLLAGAIFTGEWQDTLDYGVISVSIVSDVASATDGLEVQWSSDGVNKINGQSDVFTIDANAGKTFTFGPAARYVRIKYTNGGTNQTSVNLQVALRRVYVKPSSHRMQDSIKGEDDAELVKAVLSGKNPAGTYVNFQSTTAGNFKMSLEEYDEAVQPNRKNLEGSGDLTVGTSEVELAITGTPTHTIRIQADDDNSSTSIIYIGKTGVLSDKTNDFVRLRPGDEVIIPYDDVDNGLYAISNEAAQTINYGTLL